MSTIEEQLQNEVLRSFSAAGLGEEERLLVGFSGGPDSLCLASVCYDLAHRDSLPQALSGLGRRVALAHFDHGIRPREEREREARLVRQYARIWGFPLFSEAAGEGLLAARAREEKRSMEDLGREERMKFFQAIMENQGYSRLLLAHHGDDQMETMVMRFFQGSGIQGLRGIPPRRGFILRPLINLERKQILEYLREKQLEAMTDSTNLENHYLRNRIRNQFLPLAEEIFPGYKTSLKRLSDKMGELKDFLSWQTESALPWENSGEAWTIAASVFFSAPRVLQLESLYRLYDQTIGGNQKEPEAGQARPASWGEKRLPYRFLETLKNPGDLTSRAVLLRGHGILLEKRGERLFWGRDIVIPPKKSYLIQVNPPMEFSIGDRRFLITQGGGSHSGPGVFFEGAKIEFPLLFRSRQIGDEILLEGGTVGLKKLYNSWKIPEACRWEIPVLEDRRGIVGVLAGPWGGRNCLVRRIALEGTPVGVPEDGNFQKPFQIRWDEGVLN